MLLRVCGSVPSLMPQTCGCTESLCGKCLLTVKSPGLGCQEDRFVYHCVLCLWNFVCGISHKNEKKWKNSQNHFSCTFKCNVTCCVQILSRVERDGDRLQRPIDCPLELYAVMRKCWAYTPSERPTFAQLGTIVAEVSA